MISALFEVAREKAPSVIFVDEIESLVQSRDKEQQIAGGVLSTFLAELDAFPLNQVKILFCLLQLQILLGR